MLFVFPFLNLYGASGVKETKEELRSQLLECDINVNDNAEEKAAKKAKEAEVVQIWKGGNSVVVKNHRGIGLFKPDYELEFGEFNTFVGDVKLRDGKFYYEAKVKKIGDRMKLGFVTEGFLTSEQGNGEGVGDDDNSWGFDDWPNKHGGFGSKWKIGDTLGFACDLVKKSISFSLNGSFKAPNGMVFEKIKAEWLSPGLSGDGSLVVVNFGDRPFNRAPPDNEYMSVHDALSSSDSRSNAPGKLKLI